MQARWFVVATQPNREQRAKYALEDSGYEAFLPEYLKTRSHARKIETVRAPYYPGYCFIRFDPEITPSYPAEKAVGVIRLLRGPSEKPVPVPHGVIEELQRLSAQNSGTIKIEAEEIGKKFKPNDRIRITEGPFTGLEGLFDREEGKRMAVFLSMFRGGTTRVHFQESQLKLIGAAA